MKPYTHNKPVTVYRIYNILTKESYIGQTTDLASRLYHHFNTYIPTRKLSVAIQECTKDCFRVEVLTKCRNRKSGLKREQEYIKFYDSVNWGYNHNGLGYNAIPEPLYWPTHNVGLETC